MNPHDLYRSLPVPQREKIAKAAGTTYAYLNIKVFPARGQPLVIPRPKLMNALLKEFQGEVTRQEWLDHFYPPMSQSA